MSKKDFSRGLDSLLGESKEDKRTKAGRPRVITKSSQEGTKENETRATFIVNENQLEKIKTLSRSEGVQIKEIINRALGDFLGKWENKYGKIKSAPSSNKLQRL